MSTKSEARKFQEKLNKGPISFGQLVESHRLCDEISQAELARKMNIFRAHLCDIEKGRRLVSAERAAKFAKVLGYPVSSFVTAVLEDQLRKAGLKFRVTIDAA
jgi:transcriptional regulator with XRE-family HTH domain